MSEGKILNTSIEKAFRILDCFTTDRPELGVSEIARQLDTNKSTVYRLLTTLQNLNVLEQNDENQKYRLGLKLYSIGNRVELYQNFVMKAHPVLEAIASKYNESVHLGVFDNDQVFYLDKVEAGRGLQINTQIGSYRPLHCTGIGKLILAYLPENKQQELLKGKRSSKTKNTITTKSKILEELQVIRSNQFALDNEEYEVGLICLAVPVFDRQGQFMGGLSVSGPSARFPFEKMKNYVKSLHQYADQISEHLIMN